MIDWCYGTTLDITIQEEFEYSKIEWLRPYIESNNQKRKAKPKVQQFSDVSTKFLMHSKERR